MVSENDLKKMYWHSRRGMLELDLILVPFVEGKLQNISHQDQCLYQQLLQEEDQDLYAWLVGGKEPPTQPLKSIIDLILKE